MSWPRRLARAALVAGIVLETAVLGARELNHRRTRAYAFSLGQPVPTLVGYGLDFAAGPHAASGRCAIYRVVSNSCGYCEQEEPQWHQLAPALSAAGCKLLYVTPGLRDSPYELHPGPTPEVVWVPLDWAASVNIRITPTSFATNDGRIAWARQGMLGNAQWASLRALLNEWAYGRR